MTTHIIRFTKPSPKSNAIDFKGSIFLVAVPCNATGLLESSKMAFGHLALVLARPFERGSRQVGF